MAQSEAKLDRVQATERVHQVIQQFLQEMGDPQIVAVFQHLGWSADLERNLSLGSLERVELMLRIDAAIGIHLPDQIFTDAHTAGNLLEAALAQEKAGGALISAENIAAQTPVHGPVMTMPDGIRTLTDALLYRARMQPAQDHIFLYEGDVPARAITYGELLRGAEAVGAALQRAGLEPGGTVAIMLPTGAEFFWSFLGILLAGGVPVPLYPPFRADRIEEYATRQAAILQNAEAQFLLTFQEGERVARLLRRVVPTLRAVLTASRVVKDGFAVLAKSTDGRPALFLPHQAKPDELAFIQYTSGSTGSPKGVMLTHANLLENIRATGEAGKIGPGDVAVSWLPLYHDMGLIGAWLVPLFFGIPLAVMSPLAFLSRPVRWLDAIHRHRGTLSPAPNFAYELCVRKIPEKDLAQLDLSCWRAALNGAELVRLETVERFVARFEPYGFRRGALIPVYGLAEATLGVCSPPFGAGTKVDRIARKAFEHEGRAIAIGPIAYAPNASETALEESAGVIRFVSVGKPLPGVEVRIITSERHIAPERSEGRLLFRGPACTQGYYHNPEATRALIGEDGWLDSGDLAYEADGEFYITGRAKDLIIKGGRNLSPHEIEEIAGSVAGVRTGCVAAFGAPDERSGTEQLVVVAELRPGVDKEKVRAEIVSSVAAALGMPPDIVELVPAGSIPKTSSGKLRRTETCRLYQLGNLGQESPPIWKQAGKLAARGALPGLFKSIRNAARRGVEVIFGIYATVVVVLCFVGLRVAFVFTSGEEAAARMNRRFSRMAIRGCFLRVEMVNAELLDEWHRSGPWIFTPNHSSYLDIILLAAILPAEARFVAKREVSSMPFIRTIVRRAGHFAFDRSDARARISQSQIIENALREKRSVIIYPEGTFAAAPGVRPFQLGAFKAAVETGRPICPVVIKGAREIFRDETLLPRPGRVRITFGPLLWPSNNSWSDLMRLRNMTREMFAKNSGERLL
jgi:1-acyl-sn-glycerol-3-phosphate acyltransferase